MRKAAAQRAEKAPASAAAKAGARPVAGEATAPPSRAAWRTFALGGAGLDPEASATWRAMALGISRAGDAAERDAEAVASGVAEPPRLSAPPPSLPPGWSERLGSARGLALSEQRRLPPALRAAASRVRVHTGAGAARTSRALHANAFALGGHIGFAAGRIDDDATLAHEVAHVALSAGDRRAVLRGDWMLHPDVFAQDGPERALYRAVLAALHGGLGDTTREGFMASAQAHLAPVAAEWGDDAAAAMLQARLTTCLSMTVVAADGLPHDTFDLLAAFAVLQRHAGVDEISELGVSLGLYLLLRTLAEDIAVRLTPALTPDWESAVDAAAAGQTMTLQAGLRTTTSDEKLYRLELDGTLTALADARQTLILLTPPDDAPQRERIAQLSRRALLLQAAIDDLRSGRGSSAAGDLPARMARVGERIAAIRGTASDESRTVSELGNDASLLATRTIEPESELGWSGGDEILPEQAFAATADSATTSMLAQASSGAATAHAGADALRAELVPANPTYTLDEFAAIYRRWFAFFSPEQERADPIFTMLLAMFDAEAMADASTGRAWRTWPEAERRRLLEQATPWSLTGVPSGLSSFSGAAARAIMLSVFLPMIEDRLGRASGADFEAAMPRATAATLTASGSATSPGLELSAGFATGGGRREDATTATVRLATETAGRFRDVAASPSTGPGANAIDYGRLLGADPARLRNPDALLVGVRGTTAAEGWSYLVDVVDPVTGEPIAREHRVMPLEVARYLMERRRVEALTARRFVPTVPGTAGGTPRPIGDAAVRSRGLEAATGTNAEVLVGATPSMAPRVAANARSLTASRARGTSAPGAGELISACEAYLNGYFATRDGMEWRLAGVLILANIEHGIERDVREAFDPARLAKAAAFAAAVTTGMAILGTLGPAGQIASAGVRGYMAANNCSPLASLAGIMAWLRLVGDVESHRRARAVAMVSRPIVADLQNLLDEVASNVASRAASEAFSRLRERRPSTAAELVESMGEIARDPAARGPMQAAIDAEMQALRDAGRTDSDEYRMYAAMQARVLGAARPATADAPLVDVRSADTARVAALDWHPRTAAERAVLEAEIPTDLRGRVRFVDDPLLSGTTTRVVLGENEVRIHAGPNARAEDIRAHVEVAREQSRFVGVLGRLRALVDRIRTAISGRPGHGTRGREAQLEVEKLERMLSDAESARDDLERRSADLTRVPDAEARAALERHIESIEAQIALHARDMLSLEAGRGFVAATDAAATVRDSLTRAGVGAPAARRFVAATRSSGHLDALADLMNAGVYARLSSAGMTPERAVEILAEPGGYAALVRADRNPASPDAMRLLGRSTAEAMRDARRTEARADVGTSPADRIRGEWGVGADGRFADAELLASTGLSVRQVRNRAGSASETTTPRIVWRWRRYLDGFDTADRTRMNSDANFRRWAQRGYQANLNRDVSSPLEAGAVAAVGASPNNAGFDAGGRSTYDYREWVDDTGNFMRSRVDATRRPRGASDLYDATTRPDGIRPRDDGGFDVIEHKHLSGADRTLNDSIQLRAQREMASEVGRGRHVLVLSSDLGVSGALPTVDVSRTLASAPDCDIFFYDGTRITHRYDASRTPPWQPYSS